MESQQILDYRLPGYRKEYITEPYVASPPALFILDREGNVFTLGHKYQERRDRPKGHYAFNVLRNNVDTGEYASHIEKRNGRVRIFTGEGYKYWVSEGFV